MSGLLGAGDLYFNRIVGGSSVGYSLLGNVTQLALQEPNELKERISKKRNSRGASLDAAYIKTPATMSFSFDEIDWANLELALLGDRTAVSTGSGTMTNVAVVTKDDKWVEIGHRNIATAGLVVTNVAGSTTYVLGTDYEFNYNLGMIKVIGAGAIGTGETVHIDGTYGAISGSKVVAGTNTVLQGAFLLDGKNLADDSPFVVTIPKAIVAPSSPIDFLADDFTSVEFSGRPILLTGQTAAWYVEQLAFA